MNEPSIFRRKILAKIMLVAAPAVVLFLVAYLGVDYALNNASEIERLEESSSREAFLFREDFEGPMAKGKDAETAEKFLALGKRSRETKAYLLDFDGVATYASDPAAVRKKDSEVFADPTLREWVKKVLRGEAEELHGFLGETYYKVVQFKNEPRCYHCHMDERRVLGAMVYDRDLTALHAKARNLGFLRAGVLVLGVGVLLATLGVYIFSTVLKPLIRASRYAAGVKDGCYYESLSVRTVDEIGALSDSLNGMCASIKEKIGFSDGILKAITVPSVVCDLEGNISLINPMLVNFLGLSKEPADYVGMPVAEFFASAPVIAKALADAYRERRIIANLPYEGHDSHGERFFVRVDAAPIYDLDHNLLGSLAMLAVLTDVKEQEEKLQVQNEMIKQTVSEVAEIVGQADQAMSRLSQQVDQTVRGANLQTQRTAETARSVEHMNATVGEVARNAAEAANQADGARTQAVSGALVVRQAVAAITAVEDQAGNLKLSMDDLGRQAEGIGQIITVIQDIADQTNLLALNAAIEAARAGETGRGFAVVADEVRKLAEKTMRATIDVSEAIKNIQRGAKDAASSTDKAAKSVASAAALAGQSGVALQEIVALVEGSSHQVQSIANAVKEQSAASREINNAVDEVNKVSAQTLGGMSTAAEAVQQLRVLVEKLTDLTHKLKAH